MPPASAAQRISPVPDSGLGLSFLLGNEYERKKKKLQQELQLDYKQYAAQKKDLKISEPRPQPHGLSLPIADKISVQEKLREERNKEYNLFLQEKAHIKSLKRGAPSVTSKVEASAAVYIPSQASPQPIPTTHTNIHPPPRERPASRRDAATLTEAMDNKKSTETHGTGHRGRRRWQIHRRKEHYSSEEEPLTDKEDELEFRHRKQQDRHTPEPKYKEERRNRKYRANRTPGDIMEVEATGVLDQNNNQVLWNLQMPDSMRTAAGSRPATSKNKAEFATGLMIGAAEEKAASQMRKEQYKQELLKQIAEQQRNKIREKKLELRVAATGATDPEKPPDRIKQFGAVNRQYNSWRGDIPYKPGTDLEAAGKDQNSRPKDNKLTEDSEQKAPPGKPYVGYGAALSELTGKTTPLSRARAAEGVSTLEYFNEDYHRDFSNILGDVANPRVAGVPPPALPAVTDNYKTPYDAAYHYYGTRNPLDPYLPYNQNDLPGRGQLSGNFHSPLQRPSGHVEATDQHRASPLDVGELPAEKSKQRREIALSYQEALIQQIKERQELKRREKEERERYDAKIEAEMMAYNPWGRSGGGAPIKDQQGNLVSDLNQMHRTNEESHRSPVSRNNGQTQNVLMWNGPTPRVPRGVSGLRNQPTPQQVHMQDRYKEELKRQIEENKTKQIEETERMRIEEEKEEKRLADQRARIQQEYEEEQRQQKKIEHRLENNDWIHETKTQHQEPEKRMTQEEEIERRVPDSARDREEKKTQWSYEREPSPPIPTLQRRQTNPVASRPPSVVSQLSTRTERSVSAPQSRPVPARIPQLQDAQQEVIRELSALRRYLRKEQRQLEVQLGQADRQENHEMRPNRPRGRARVDVFESTHKQAVQPSTRSPSTGAACVNMQNIREFNQLKYRDTESREEVRHMYPDPPTDAQSLDIQQQALLREQQRKIRLMKREEEQDFLDLNPSHYRFRNKPGRYIHRDSILPSETAFIDVNSGAACEEQLHQQRARQPSAGHQERRAPRRRRDYDELPVSINQGDCNIETEAQSLQSATSLNLESKGSADSQHRITRQGTGDHNSRSEGPSVDEVDVLSLRSALERRVSLDTVATDAWLRPGTSDTVKRSGCRETPNTRRDAPPWLTHRVI